MTGARRPLLLAAAALSIGACANVLELNAYTDAIRALCKADCGIEDCDDRLSTRLDEATDQQVDEWLGLYGELHCDRPQCQTTALQCFYGAPSNCAKTKEPCERAEECCAFNFPPEDPSTGETCCYGGGGEKGTCCASCVRCEDAMKAFIVGDLDLTKLCKSHEATWNDLFNCALQHCQTQCETKIMCGSCVGTSCGPQVDACEDNEAL